MNLKAPKYSTLDSINAADNVSMESPHKITLHASILEKNSQFQMNRRRLLNYNSTTTNNNAGISSESGVPVIQIEQ